MSYSRWFTNLDAQAHANYLRQLDRVCKRGLAELMPGTKPKLLGRGMFCSVFEGPTPNTVVRFNTSYGKDGDYLRSCSAPYFSGESLRFRQQIVDECDEVNEVMFELTSELEIAQVGFSITERLKPFKDRSLCYHTNKLLHMFVSNGAFKDLAPSKVQFDEKYVDKWAKQSCLAGLETFAEELSRFCADYGLRIDNVRHDLMLREDTGDIVITDPVLKSFS